MSIKNSILSFCKGQSFYNTNNRYSLDFFNSDSAISSLYFSAPIKDINSKRLICDEFIYLNDCWVYRGSTSTIVISKNLISIFKDKITVLIELSNKFINGSNKEVTFDNLSITPTLNGLLFTSTQSKFEFSMHTSFRYDVRLNDRFVALLEDEFTPFLSISSLGVYDAYNSIVCIPTISYKKKKSVGANVTIEANEQRFVKLQFELNMYEPKLIEDTTIESKKPYLNNVYGSIALLGCSEQCGVQWLYSKLDPRKLHPLPDKKIKKITLNYFKQGTSKDNIYLCKLKDVFCSFGAHWDNKTEELSNKTEATINDLFYAFDITEMITKEGILNEQVFSFVIKSSANDTFLPIYIADSYAFPPLVLIEYF